MIRTDQELEATAERIRRFLAQIVQIRKVEVLPENYRPSAASFVAEIDRMNLEIRDYLLSHPSEADTPASA
jgi:hypothetical protein